MAGEWKTMDLDQTKERAAQLAREDARRDAGVLEALTCSAQRDEIIGDVLERLGVAEDASEVRRAAWDSYYRELQEIRDARQNDRADWARVADGLFDWYREEEGISPRALRRQQDRILDNLFRAATAQLERLPAERLDGVRGEAEVRELLREDWQRLLNRRADRPLWQDLAEVLRAAGDGAEVHWDAAVSAARAAGSAIAHLHPLGQQALQAQPVEFWRVRVGLAERDYMRRGTTEKMARRAASEALRSLLRLLDNGAVSNAVTVWRHAHEALGHAYDGPGREGRREHLQKCVLLALSPALRHAMGISDEEEARLAPKPGEPGASYAAAQAHEGRS